MGAASSVDVRLGRDECEKIVGCLFNSDLFEENKDENNTIAISDLLNILSKQTDVFLTHDWGRELGVDNHERVGKVNEALQKLGYRTWFDSQKMEGNIKKKMINGIDYARCILVFVTKRFV